MADDDVNVATYPCTPHMRGLAAMVVATIFTARGPVGKRCRWGDRFRAAFASKKQLVLAEGDDLGRVALSLATQASAVADALDGARVYKPASDLPTV